MRAQAVHVKRKAHIFRDVNPCPCGGTSAEAAPPGAIVRCSILLDPRNDLTYFLGRAAPQQNPAAPAAANKE
jgi:hypothetical protein